MPAPLQNPMLRRWKALFLSAGLLFPIFFQSHGAVADQGMAEAAQPQDLETPKGESPILLPGVGQLSLSPGWSLKQVGQSTAKAMPAEPGEEANEAQAVSGDDGQIKSAQEGGGYALFRHESGLEMAIMALPQSQALSLKRLSGQMAPGYRDRQLEEFGGLWWWHTFGTEGSDLHVYATGVGGLSVLVSVTGSEADPRERVAPLLSGLQLEAVKKHIDETWIAFDMPADVVYVHRDSSPYSWRRGKSIAAIDLTFQRSDAEDLVSTDTMADLAAQLPDWIVADGRVALHLKGVDQLAQLDPTNPPDEALKALIASPGSLPGHRAIALVKRVGIMRIELRAEGDDALLLAYNDLLPIAKSLLVKEKYDWFYDARKMKHGVSPEFAEQVFLEAAPSLTALAALTAEGMGGAGWNTPMDSGLTALQTLPMVGFQLFEIGKARTPTEDTIATNMGYIPASQFILMDYFDQEGAVVGTSMQGVGASIAAGTRFFRQRGQIGVNWQVYWPQDGQSLIFDPAESYGIQSATYQPTWAKMRGGYLVDPTSWILPHRMGRFGEWSLGIGLGTNIEMATLDYVDPDGKEETILFYNTAFSPMAGFQSRLFWGALNLSAHAYWVPPQLGLVNIFRDTAVESQLESGEVEIEGDLNTLVREAGISALMTQAVGSGQFMGSKGLYATATLGIPMDGGLFPPIQMGLKKGQGPLPPLGAKLNRFSVLSSLGLGLTVFMEETQYLPFTTPWKSEGTQQALTTLNRGFIIGLGSGTTYLPSFGTNAP